MRGVSGCIGKRPMEHPDLVERALQIVEDALELRGEERRQHIERGCAGDAELRREVESLLSHEGNLDIVPEQTPANSDTSERDDTEIDKK